jgi:hypothetical protein
MATPKEDFYDKKIAPLMKQVIALSKEAKINMAATFALDPNEDDGAVLYCTTIIPVDPKDKEGSMRLKELEAVLYPKPTFMAFAITTASKETTNG